MKDYFAHETAVIDIGANIAKDVKIWHFSHIMSGAIIGEKCNIGQNVFIAGKVILGRNVKIQNNVSVYAGVICEDVLNPRSAVNRQSKYTKTKIGRGATIGANATIVCGSDIGEYAFIGAGSVVTKTVLPYALLVGNPAKQIGWMSELGHRLEFDVKGKAYCAESNEIYYLENGKVHK